MGSSERSDSHTVMPRRGKATNPTEMPRRAAAWTSVWMNSKSSFLLALSLHSPGVEKNVCHAWSTWKRIDRWQNDVQRNHGGTQATSELQSWELWEDQVTVLCWTLNLVQAYWGWHDDDLTMMSSLYLFIFSNSIMAVRAGSRSVYACEVSGVLNGEAFSWQQHVWPSHFSILAV